MGSADLQHASTALRGQADALAALELGCARLGRAHQRPHEELDALAAAIDERIDECLRISALVVGGEPGAGWRDAVTELERQMRRLGVLRSEVLALYLPAGEVRCGC